MDWEICPFGVPGERLWVKETFARRLDVDPAEEPSKARHYALYRADGTSLDEPHWHSYPGRWTPSIHMPRWASRITLEITGVRVQRLNCIADADAIAEGARWFDAIPVGPLGSRDRWSMGEPETTDECLHSPRLAFANLWEKLHGEGAWDVKPSPWVWCISFRRLPQQDA
jgi:hypothetical protein